MGFETFAPGQGALYVIKKRKSIGFLFSLIGNEHNRINEWFCRLILLGVDECIYLLFLFNPMNVFGCYHH